MAFLKYDNRKRAIHLSAKIVVTVLFSQFSQEENIFTTTLFSLEFVQLKFYFITTYLKR